ncbi:MAG: type II secretion system protein [Acidobacteria bacterium]|nr:type II secretion system protein [Acidobacteriota bacterium]
MSTRDQVVNRAANRAGERGLTLAELIVAAAILLILSSAAVPLARVQLRRNQERELRIALREIRTAIDRYKDASDLGMIQVELGTEGYPKDLETMVEGVSLLNSPDDKKLRVLRRLPRDPMTNSTDWGLRAYQDEPDSTAWGGENVFDVYTKSPATALDGSAYADW